MITNKYKEIIKAAKVGGVITKKYFGKVLEVEGKTIPADVRTKADLESELAIIKILTKSFPDYNIISEETGEINKSSEYTFYVDPLDGTNNFVLGIPYFCTAIGLMKGEETIFGVIYNPLLDNLYFAEKGRGAYLNGKKINVNMEADIRNSTISMCYSYRLKYKHEAKTISALTDKAHVKRVLRNWSLCLDLCLLASGKVEALIVREIPTPHDFVAGKLIAMEAGAAISNLKGDKVKGDKDGTFLISNGTNVHSKLVEILK